ncbi:sigma factor-like helix-turn-helix DNA-binding protein [Paenibacillus brasilensis]|uniref:RNA polymerase sigma factor (Sigma-70 family) n=1 Tax=Paenibacillus brasilensis TaxID=128574 RepID=A0ABU0KSW2_9BACL|nr:sigma factor-like helix-turn-helix DNA-binding protein [Paenibacillus brasilensis]MDQ0492528.1 RNA polymerase sigma factor (sigma-70 family) [Paenibacillus brasilensis]
MIVKTSFFIPYRYADNASFYREGDSILIKQGTTYERCRTEIYRIAWRIQYRAKKIRNSERSFSEIKSNILASTVLTENKIWIQQLLNSLPPQGKSIIYKLYIEDLTEYQVAQQLHISQQAVSKWKKKMLRKLSQTVNF